MIEGIAVVSAHDWQEAPALALGLRANLADQADRAIGALSPILGDEGRIYVDGDRVVVEGVDPFKTAACRYLFPDYPLDFKRPRAGSVLIKAAARDWDIGRIVLEDPMSSPEALARAMASAAFLAPPRIKKADDSATGAFYTAPIPVDSFNQAIWTDAINTGNTPMPVAATASSILQSASYSAGRPTVTPWEIAVSAAAGAGKGLIAGLAAGKVMGALGLVSPQAQSDLQRAGLWGGMLTGALSPLFGR